MKEIINASGRSNYLIDPSLEIWNWEIPLYLFLGGISAGILFFTALSYLRNSDREIEDYLKKSVLFTPIFLSIGLIVLMLDLKNPLLSWRLYTNFNIESPMSWGAWTLMLIVPLSYAISAVFLKDLFKFEWPLKILNSVEEIIRKNFRIIFWILLIFSLILGIYTGVLLSAFNARPFWNNPILGPLFLISGLSAASALIFALSKKKSDIEKYVKINLTLLIVEAFFITHLFMGMLAGNSNQLLSVDRFIGGEFTYSFFGFDILLGIMLPIILEALYLKGKKVPIIIPALLVLIGGVLFRFMMVEAGQSDILVSIW
jgi:protein NrfD